MIIIIAIIGGFGANTSTGFGQSSFGAKPTGTAAPTFQTPGFGTNTSMFGSAAPATSQPSGGLFGTPTATFGATQPSTGFGAPATNTGFGGNYNFSTSMLFCIFLKLHLYS